MVGNVSVAIIQTISDHNCDRVTEMTWVIVLSIQLTCASKEIFSTRGIERVATTTIVRKVAHRAGWRARSVETVGQSSVITWRRCRSRALSLCAITAPAVLRLASLSLVITPASVGVVAAIMSALSDSPETTTSAQQPTEMNWTVDSAMPDDHSSPTDTSAFKAIFIPLYCIVFSLCFAGQLPSYSAQCSTYKSLRSLKPPL